MNVTVRRAEHDDIDALAQRYVEFHNFHAVGVPSRMQAVEYDQRLPEAIQVILDNPRAALFVAVAGDEVCGFAEIYIRETEPTPALVARKYAHLQSLAVTAVLRKHGIGAQLLKAAHRWAVSNGATAVELDTWEFGAGPLRFYESLGYETIKRTLVCDLTSLQPTKGE